MWTFFLIFLVLRAHSARMNETNTFFAFDAENSFKRLLKGPKASPAGRLVFLLIATFGGILLFYKFLRITERKKKENRLSLRSVGYRVCCVYMDMEYPSN